MVLLKISRKRTTPDPKSHRVTQHGVPGKASKNLIARARRRPRILHSGYHLSGRASGFEGWYHRLTVDDASPSSTPSLMRRTKRARGTAATCRCAVPMGGHMARRPSCELLGRQPQACSRQVLSRCRLLENGLASGLRPLRAGRFPAQQHPAPGRAARWIRPVELRGRASGRRLVPEHKSGAVSYTHLRAHET